ncbi:MAG: M18 family aminopeptidase [Nitrospinota bacterium]|nr:M18 family aminopeptidase [Nitrospinota bacterium]
MKRNLKTYRKYAESLLEFIDASPTPFHATGELAALLKAEGFAELQEADSWSLKKNGRYYVTRNDSSLVAFVMGSQSAEQAGFKIIGAHTDSPNLRLKPNPAYEKSGYVQLGVEVYGGVLLATWTDRDLSLAGRVVLESKKGQPVSRLLKIDKPLLRIPQLAIHLNREVNDKGLKLNKQTHLPPILQMAEKNLSSEKVLKELVAGELKCKVEEIVSLDLALYDVQASTFAGPNDEFVFAPRLDNLASCHAATIALLEAPKQDSTTRVLAFYDHEEVGSESAQGGGSPFLKDALERIVMDTKNSREALMRAIAKSVFISADMAHAVHPNYADKHEDRHLPLINAGPVIKTNAGQRYATDGVSSAHFELLCKRAGVNVQKFVVRSDMGCGSTIGPITAANLGIRTVDVGNPMLSMHSIREMAGSQDHGDLIQVFREYFSAE